MYGYRPNPFVYSPFSSSINRFYYTSVRGVIHGDGDDYTYNITMCATSCPLKVMSPELPLVLEGGCPKDRAFANCYVRILDYEYPDDISPIDSLYYSRYMLKNSKMTLSILFEPSHMEPVRLCITTDNVTCNKVFYNNMECPEVLDFNQANNYSQTFTAPADSYYCAIWLIKEANHSINYTTTLEIVSYQSPTSGLCKNFNTSNFTLDLRFHRPKIATRYQDVCLFVQNNAANQGSTILLISVIARWFQNLASVLIGMIFIILMIIMAAIFLFNCYKYMKRKSCS